MSLVGSSSSLDALHRLPATCDEFEKADLLEA